MPCKFQVGSRIREATNPGLGLVMALVCLVLVGCGAQQPDGTSSESSAVVVHQDPSSADPGATVPRSLTAHFALLRTPAEGLPPDVMKTINVPVAGMEWDLARRLPIAKAGSYWLAPGTKDLCVVSRPPGSVSIGTVCATIGQALRHGVANTSLDPVTGARTIVGVAPDGAGEVVIRSEKSTESVRVKHGEYLLRDSVQEPPNVLIPR